MVRWGVEDIRSYGGCDSGCSCYNTPTSHIISNQVSLGEPTRKDSPTLKDSPSNALVNKHDEILHHLSVLTKRVVCLNERMFGLCDPVCKDEKNKKDPRDPESYGFFSRLQVQTSNIDEFIQVLDGEISKLESI